MATIRVYTYHMYIVYVIRQSASEDYDSVTVMLFNLLNNKNLSITNYYGS